MLNLFLCARFYKLALLTQALILGPEVVIFTTNIRSRKEYDVAKVFQGRYHFSKDVYLANLLLHLKLCLTIKVRPATTSLFVPVELTQALLYSLIRQLWRGTWKSRSSLEISLNRYQPTNKLVTICVFIQHQLLSVHRVSSRSHSTVYSPILIFINFFAMIHCLYKL